MKQQLAGSSIRPLTFVSWRNDALKDSSLHDNQAAPYCEFNPQSPDWIHSLRCPVTVDGELI